jgi:hypothetical protein
MYSHEIHDNIVTYVAVAGQWEVQPVTMKTTLDKWSVAKLHNSKESGVCPCRAELSQSALVATQRCPATPL